MKRRIVTGKKSSRAIAELFFDIGAVHFDFGKGFTFTSGIVSPVYVDGRMLAAHPHAWHTVVDAFTALTNDADIVAGVATGGIPHSAAVAFKTHKPHAFVRKAPKQHGTKQSVEGAAVSGKSVALIEDMVTTGGSVFAAVDVLYKAGASHVSCVSIATYGFQWVIDRFVTESILFTPLTSVQEIAEAAHKRRILSRQEYDTVRTWLLSQDIDESLLY